ncbi:MAG: class I SAM-dependent methyltransferase [Crocinitomicaceae bacterium]|jgi:predicted O-methyltransferase YrrM|nr:class I SAM-dependent methyltransferase [Crocinitomicaceae bacterium]
MILVFLKANPLPGPWLTEEQKIAKSEEVIYFTEYGAGSKSLTSERAVREVYKRSRTHQLYGKVLYQLIVKNNINTALEFGTSLGMGTRYLSLGCDEVISIEGCANTARFARRHFQTIKATNIILIESTFDDYLLSPQTFDLVYIDGNHQGEFLEKYIARLREVSPHCLFVCDDIRWSKDMRNSFKKLTKDFKYSMDLYQMGVLCDKNILL